MTYWFLTSGNSQRDYSTFFEASTKCYHPLVESPLRKIEKKTVKKSTHLHAEKLFSWVYSVLCVTVRQSGVIIIQRPVFLCECGNTWPTLRYKTDEAKDGELIVFSHTVHENKNDIMAKGKIYKIEYQ